MPEKCFGGAGKERRTCGFCPPLMERRCSDREIQCVLGLSLAMVKKRKRELREQEIPKNRIPKWSPADFAPIGNRERAMNRLMPVQESRENEARGEEVESPSGNVADQD